MIAAMAPSVGPGDGPDSLAALHGEHYRPLVRLASLLIDDQGVCEELVQDAFVAVWRRRAALLDPDRLPAYLRSAVLNGARSHLRKREVRRRHRAPEPAAVPSAEAGAVAAEETRTVVAALRALPDRQREVLALRYYLDLSEAEIASTLGISPGSVKTHAHRGLAALAPLLEER
jgi:RNA polymerase sigma-70 factor (sigma-E family)